MNRKGFWFLLPYALRIVLAILTIALLIFLAIALGRIIVGGVEGKQDFERAKIVLGDIAATADKLEEGNSTTMDIQGIDGWYLISFDNDIEGVPDECIGEGCICLCSGASPGSCVPNVGACEKFNQGVDVFTLPFSRTSGSLVIGTTSYSRECIVLSKGFVSVELVKSEERLEISSPSVHESESKYQACSVRNLEEDKPMGDATASIVITP